MSKLTVICVLALAGLATVASGAPPKGLPPNTINCKDFTPLPRDFWYAHKDAKPFDVDHTRAMTVRDSTFAPHLLAVGKHGYDLSELLDRKCGHRVAGAI